MFYCSSVNLWFLPCHIYILPRTYSVYVTIAIVSILCYNEIIVLSKKIKKEHHETTTTR